MNNDFGSLLPIVESVALTVGQLNLMIARLLEQNLAQVRVCGEISNFANAASGHWYFSLKDEQAQIRCVMFRGRNQSVNFFPKDGQAVEIKGLVSLYGPRGELQINVEALQQTGAGDLFLAFQRLKEKLAQDGLFDSARKRPLPLYPRSVGVITSLHAAALADVLTVFARRAPYLQIYIYPAPVQGIEAAHKLATMLDQVNQRAEVDVVLLCRGGGSIEDLWAFNEEVLARAIVRSQLPVVVGVGHETDFTIADFSADVRAPTPSAAAELLSKDRIELLRTLKTHQQRFKRCVQRHCEIQAQRLDGLSRRLPHPRARLMMCEQALEQIARKLLYEMTMHLLQARAHLREKTIHLTRARPHAEVLNAILKNAYMRLRQAHMHLLSQSYNRWQLAQRQLTCLDPQRTLDRGYAVLFNQYGEAVRNPEQLVTGVPMKLQVAQGRASIELSKIELDKVVE